jgi:hypothetical protein
MNQLLKTRQGGVGRDIQRRALRVTQRMKINASGRPGPNIQTRNLYEAISFLRFGVDGEGILADVGPQGHRSFRRGWNYPVLLEFGHGTTPAYPFLARSLDAAK